MTIYDRPTPETDDILVPDEEVEYVAPELRDKCRRLEQERDALMEALAAAISPETGARDTHGWIIHAREVLRAIKERK